MRLDQSNVTSANELLLQIVVDYDPLDDLDDPVWISVETSGYDLLISSVGTKYSVMWPSNDLATLCDDSKTVEARFSIEGWFMKEGVRSPFLTA